MANSTHSCTFKLGPMGQTLRPSYCCIVSQEKNKFRLHQFFEGQFLSENKTISL